MSIPRFQLFEFSDQSWLPLWIREGFTDYLAMLYRLGRPLDVFCEEILRSAPQKKIQDLCSGSGEGLIFLLEYLESTNPEKSFTVIGSDLHPNIAAFERLKALYRHFDYVPTSVDVLQLPGPHACCYTMVSALHHFAPEQVAKLLRTCVQNGSSFIALEVATRHNIFNYLFLPVEFLCCMAKPFFAQRWSWRKFLFSTIIPVIPVIATFDGFISILRYHTKEELEAIAHQTFPEGNVIVDYQERRYKLLFKSYMCRFQLVRTA